MRTTSIMSAWVLLGFGLLLAGCGPAPDSGAEADGPGAAAVPVSEADDLSIPEPMQAFSDDGDVVEIDIEADDRIRFDIDQFSVGAGQMVRLTLHHTGTLPAQAMGHNVVILYPGDDVFDFGADVGEFDGGVHDDFVPEELRDRVVAFTAITGGGEVAVVEFQAPSEPGDYPFLCSFPGHFGQMNGTMEVE